MRGLYEWIAFTGGMVLAGVALLAFFFNPLVLVVILFAIGLYVAVFRVMNWMAAPATRQR